MIKELILTTMFSFAPLINGVSPSKADVLFSSSESETSEEVVTLDDGKTYRKVYEGVSNDVNSNDDLIYGNYYRLNLANFNEGKPLWDAYEDNEIDDIYIEFYDLSYNVNNNYNFFVEESYLDVVDEDFISYFTYNISDFNFLYIYQTLPLNDYFSFYYVYGCEFWEIVTSENSLYFYVNFNEQVFNGFLSDLLDISYFYIFFENAGDNIPYHYEEIVKGHTLFDIINDWFLSLFSNETLDSYKFNLFGKEVSMTQYLCNVATIITLVSLVIAVVSITIFIFKLSAGLFKW